MHKPGGPMTRDAAITALVEKLDAVPQIEMCMCGKLKSEHAFYNDRIYDIQGLTCPTSTGGEYRYDAMLTARRFKEAKAAGLADTLSALGGRDGKATGLVLYDQLKDLWSAMAFDPETMPVPIMREACKVTKETLDAMLKGFEGKSFRQWCDEQWSDGIPEPAALGGRPETGWQPEFVALVKRVQEVLGLDEDSAITFMHEAHDRRGYRLKVERELALLREAALDESLSRDVLRAIVLGVQEPTSDDIAWAREALKRKASPPLQEQP